MSFAADYLDEVVEIAGNICVDDVERMAGELSALRDRGGRLYIIGLGGSLANAHHAVNDFRKLCGIDAFAPQASELTARANDEGWSTAFLNPYLKPNDALLVLSVGGGTEAVSLPLVEAIKAHKGRILGIVGRDGGYTKRNGDCVVVVPDMIPERVTPHTEAFQSVILHLLVSHPKLQQEKTKW